MKDSPVIAFIKYILFKKIPLNISIWIICMATMLISWFALIKTSIPIFAIIYLIAFITCLITGGIDLILFFYNYFKKYVYGRTKPPEEIEEINLLGVPSDIVGIVKGIVAILKRHGERIANIEKNLSPFRISLFAILVGVSVAVALLLIAPLFQKILFPR